MKNRGQAGRAASRTRLALWALAAMAIACMALGGCAEEKYLPFRDVKVQIPDFGDTATSGTVTSRQGGRINENLRIHSDKSSIPQKYLKWFEKNQWKVGSINQDINQLNAVLTKDNVTLTMTYAPRDGTFIQVSQPEATEGK